MPGTIGCVINLIKKTAEKLLRNEEGKDMLKKLTLDKNKSCTQLRLLLRKKPGKENNNKIELLLKRLEMIVNRMNIMFNWLNAQQISEWQIDILLEDQPPVNNILKQFREGFPILLDLPLSEEIDNQKMMGHLIKIERSLDTIELAFNELDVLIDNEIKVLNSYPWSN